MHLTMASRMLVRVRSRQWNCRSQSTQLGFSQKRKWPLKKPISPISPTREARITTTRLSSTGTRTSMTLTRCVFQTLRLRFAGSPPSRSSLSPSANARPPASTGSRNRRGPGSSPGGVPVLAQVGVQPGRRALGRSLHAQTRRSLTRACRSLARSLVRYPGSSGSSPPPFAGRFSTIPGRTERIATPRL